MNIIMDPQNKHKDLDGQTFLNSIGLIPSFIDESLEYDELVKTALEAYGMNCCQMTGNTISEELVMSYPGDPDLYLIALLITKSTDVVIYQCGIVSFISKDRTKKKTYRMD